MVALSRIHTKIHHASDVAGGVAIGVALGHLARRIVPLQPSGTARRRTRRSARGEESPSSWEATRTSPSCGARPRRSTSSESAGRCGCCLRTARPTTPSAYAREAASRELGVVIAGAGGAAHLAGVIAAVTTLPVIGVPIALSKLDGLDSLLSMVQMPRGIPVATVAIDGARNAGLLAARILALGDERPRDALVAHAERLAEDVRARDRALQERLGSA